MNQIVPTVPKNPVREPAEDFYRLRREGIGYIEQAGSKLWTDYNVHDPGITILEATCYGITDLAYRIAWDIADILSPQTPSTDPLQPYPNQAFFTARKILTINPTTADDFRRLLIDLPGVRNAWVTCKECACDVSYFAWCNNNHEMQLAYEKPANAALQAKEVWALGLYEALLELEEDPELGDLNDRMIEYASVHHDGNGAHRFIAELRFPDISLSNREQWELFLDSGAIKVRLTRLGATKTYDVFSDLATDADRDTYIRDHWRTLFYVSFKIDIIAIGKAIDIENASLRLFGDTVVRNSTTADGLTDLFEDSGAKGFIQQYWKKAIQARDAVRSAKTALQTHRNLDEDYCIVNVMGVEEVAVCADVEVAPDADIEWVQANIWFAIEQYFNPPILFHALQELRDAGEPVEEIFNGLELHSGFIKADELKAASVKTVLRVSDIVNLLMDIDGVIAVNQMRLSKYDAEGNLVAGAADPTWSKGKPVFDPNKTSAAWLLFISSRHQPRLYRNFSRFLFYKNGLPFTPRMDEASDTLNELRGDAERPKNPNAANDLPIPKGIYRNPEDYYPLQYGFPLTYGIGPAGLPSQALPKRIGQARQLKAYLMVFEQVLGNALAQLAHTADLFSFDPAVKRTYFVMAFNEALIKGFDDIKQSGMSQAAVEALSESANEFLERRNRFLDHLLARFGEDFAEYALLLGNAAGRDVAEQRVIDYKIWLLKRYPVVSHDRAKAFDYSVEPCSPGNIPGIKKRISLLLGYPDLTFDCKATASGGGKFAVQFQLIDGNRAVWLDGGLTLAAADEAAARQAAYREIIERMILEEAYDLTPANGKFPVKLKSKTGTILGHRPEPFDAAADAAAMRDELLAWAANERLIVVEHVLLRPKFPGDALYPACCDGTCCTCGDEDPYSFRLTFVMPGWTAQYTDNLDLRRFADRTIQQETPSHLLGKICWVGNDGVVENPCDEVVGQLADLLIAKGLKANGAAPNSDDACACALNIYHAFSTVFAAWYEDKTLDYFDPAALNTLIAAQFAAAIKPADINCVVVLTAPLWTDVQSLMTAYFVQMARNGWQFERFEAAWCAWLKANAAIDWVDERLLDRLQALLAGNLVTEPVDDTAVCQCAHAILNQYGAAFYQWMGDNVKTGKALNDFPTFNPPAINLCPGMSFKPGTDAAAAAFLEERYAAYREVSYRLWVVVNLLSKLSNTYPGATLHDCDEGSDFNPVRLDNTALGNYPLRTSLP